MKHIFYRSLVICSLAWGTAVAAAPTPGDGQKNNAPQAIPAGVVTLQWQAVPLTLSLSGQALSEQDATIRPLVDGVITDILYHAGTTVNKGDPLFQIEQESYAAALEVARAELASAEAALPSAQDNLKRYEKLAGTGVTQAEVDSARTALRQAQAAIAAARADVRSAKINLDRTTIVSPITGMVANAEVSIGDLVTAGQSGELTTVTRLDPIYVDLSEASSRVLEMRKRIESGEITRGSEIETRLVLENGEQYSVRGVVESLGRKVSTTTGTLTVRVKFDNPDLFILPGMFLRASLTLGHIEAYRVPQLAAKPQPDGTVLTWVLDKENKAKKFNLTPAGNYDNSWIIHDGLNGPTTVLVDNLDNLREGMTIKPISVSINQQGVIVTPSSSDNANQE